ncbi:M28 family peptidase [candidate division KSB1 bacterium]
MESYFKTIIFVLMIFITACKRDRKPEQTDQEHKKEIKLHIPDFNADSAYAYIEKQVSFGPRVPNTSAHKLCAEFLLSKLKQYTPNVREQNFKTRVFDGNTLIGKNIIASFYPESKGRILLAAHWDSRPFADHDPDPNMHETPIVGANDGASGVGVLIEIARQLQINKPNIGVDIIFFDIEDYGEPHDLQTGKVDTWGLGSQYWSKNPHVVNYQPRYGILLDMIGAKDATFTREAYSMEYASDIVKKVWDIGTKIGYSRYFLNNNTGYITDDHYYVNKISRIPMIDIIHINPENHGFFEHWHTVNDNMEHIDKNTLKAVGETVLTVLFLEK